MTDSPSQRLEPVTIVTGGLSGLGAAIVLTLARAGHRVVACGLVQAQVSSTAQGMHEVEQQAERDGLLDRIVMIEADVSSAADVQRVVDTALARFGRVDNLVNNAAIGPLGTVLDTSEALFNRILAVNVTGAFLCSKAVIPSMQAQGGGAIVNVGSGAGWGKPNMAAYSASKGALVALSMAMAYDHMRDRIRVNVAIPGGGGIVSGMSVGRMGGDLQAFQARSIPGTAAGRPIKGEDLAQAIAFLLSPQAEAISGTVLDVGCFSQQGGPVPQARV